MNDRKYGGGGIFNLYATVAAENAFTSYVFGGSCAVRRRAIERIIDLYSRPSPR